MALSYDDPLQNYRELPGLGTSMPQITDSSVEKILKDRQKRLQGMALMFDLGNPRKFQQETLKELGTYFVLHINSRFA